MVKKDTNFDDELWCEDCGVGYTSSCVKHGGYSRIKDKAIPSRARLTAPHQLVVKMLEMTADHSHVYGVFAKKVIQKRTQLGPYEGQISETWQHGRGDRIKLKLCLSSKNSVYFDCKNEAECNWMMFVRPAKTPKEQNLVAFQHKGEIFFVTTKAIRINEELKVWYSRSYEHLIRQCNGIVTTRSDSMSQQEMTSRNETTSPENMTSPDITMTQRRSTRRKHASRGKKSKENGVSQEIISNKENTFEAAPFVTLAPFATSSCNTADTDASANADKGSLSTDVQGATRGRKRKAKQRANDSKSSADKLLQGDPFQSAIHFTVGGTEITVNPIVPEPAVDHDSEDYAELHGFDPVESKQNNGDALGNVDQTIAVSHHDSTAQVVNSFTAGGQEYEKRVLIREGLPSIVIEQFQSPQQQHLNTSQNTHEIVTEEPPTMLDQTPIAVQVDKEITPIVPILTREEETVSMVTSTVNTHKKEPPVKKGKKKKPLPKRKEKRVKDESMEDEFRPRDAFDCTGCELIFSSQLNLDTHMRLIHSGEKPFLCTVCEKRFQTAFKLKRHMTSHGKGAQFSCPYCDKSFGRKDHLKSHLRVHNPTKEVYDCTFCDKKYYSLYAFKCHIAQHNADRGGLTCSVCDKEFQTPDEIQYHLKVHAGSRTVKDESQKKHKCPKCDMKFYTKKDIERHIVTHTKQRAFMCHLCPQRFGRQDHLTRHIRTAHSGSTKRRRKADPEDRSEDLLAEVDALNPVKPEQNGKSPMKTRQQGFATGAMKQDGIMGNTAVSGAAITGHDSEIKGEDMILVFDGTNLVWKKPATVISKPTATISNEILQLPSQNFTILQPAALSQPVDQNIASLASQKTIQIPTSMLATNSDLGVLQSTNISDVDIANFLKSLETEGDTLKVTESKLPKVSGKSGGKSLKRKGSGNKKTGKRGTKTRKSSSRSSLSSQPTMPVDALPGTSHLASPPVSKSNAQPTLQGASNVNISFIDKLNLTELFGEKVKSLQKNVHLQLLRELQSVTQKVTPVSSALEQAPVNQQQVLQQVPLQVPHSSIVTLNVPQNLQSSALNTGSVLQIGNRQGNIQTPSLNTVDTQSIVQQIHQLLNANTTDSQVAVDANPVPIPQNVQLLQVFDPNMIVSQLQQPNQGTPLQGQPQNIVGVVQKQEVGQQGNPQAPVQMTSQISAMIPANYQSNQNPIIMLPENWKMVHENDVPTSKDIVL